MPRIGRLFLVTVFGLLSTVTLQAQTRDQVNKGFANVKNAYLAIMKGSVEEVKGHEGWAKTNPQDSVKAELLKFLGEIEQKFEKESDKIKAKDLCLSFGFLKQAKVILVNGNEETVAAHRSWCVEATPTERVKEYAKFFRQIKEALGEM
jgi:hypothetical protein